MSSPYPPYEPGATTEYSARRRRNTIAAIIIGTLVVVVGCAAALTLPTMFADRSLDPSTNAGTGLPDGTYLMTATASYHRDDECWFRGTPRGPQVPEGADDEITLYGSGPRQCAGATYGDVRFVVTDNVAVIQKSNP